MNAPITIDTLNGMPAKQFVEALGGVFEHSPWVARKAEARRPFGSIAQLHAAMVAEIEAAGGEAQLALIRAHPDLSGKVSVANPLTPESAREQAGAGLHQCSPEERRRLLQLNRDYSSRFGFPFILAVRGYDRAGVIEQLEKRIALDPESERLESLRQIYRIALLRLDDIIRN